MYKIKTNGVERYSDTLVYAKLAENGCYVPCDMDDAEYVVGKVPTEDGVADTVFRPMQQRLNASMEAWLW